MTSEREPGREVAIGRVRAVIDRLVRDGAVATSDGAVHHLFPVAVGPAEGDAIRSWVIREAAAHTIEIGLGYGVSALFVCEGLLANGIAGACHVVIDPTRTPASLGSASSSWTRRESPAWWNITPKNRRS